jgi:hypothetical protein
MLLPGAEGTNMQLINHIIAKHLSSDEMKEIAYTLDVYLPQGSPSSMARELVDGARRQVRLDKLFSHLKNKRPQLDLTPHLHELIASTFTAEEMLQLCRLLGLDKQGSGLDMDGLVGWTSELYYRREKAKLAQERSETAAFLQAISQVKPELDLSAFTKVTTAKPPLKEPPEPLHEDPNFPEITYENFDLTITRTGSAYAVRAAYAHGGEEKSAEAELNLVKEADVKALLVSLDTLSGDLDQAEKVGRLMWERLFYPDIWPLFIAAKSDAKNRSDSGLRIRLRIEPPEIGMLPWEYCFDRNHNFLVLDPELPIVRYIDQSFIPDDVLAPKPARVLLASASPSDMDSVDAAGEAEHIYNELQPLVESGELVIKHLNPATRENFQSELVRFRPHVLHFIGHGEFDLDSGKGALILEGEDGKASPLSSRQLAALMKNKETRVIILNACKSAAFDENNAFMGLAPALVRAAVPAVIAMQFAMPDDTAARFAREIYHYLAMGLPLDRAITEARIHLYTYGEENIFWAIPVLFMRAKDGAIWKRRP